MLRNFACRLVEAGAEAPQRLLGLVVNTAELCVARYPYCRALLLEGVNASLERLGAEKISLDDFTDVETLLSQVQQRLRHYSLDKVVRGRHASREEIMEAVASAAARILYSSLLAVLDTLGIECPVWPQHGRAGAPGETM